jgi:hypothetical protein
MRLIKHGPMVGALCLVLALGVSACQKSNTSGTATTQDNATRELRVAEIELGRGVGADKRITDETTVFAPNETIYAAVLTDGGASDAELKARWTFQDGQVVEESTQRVSPTGGAATEFHVTKPDGWPEGKYKVEVFLNGASAGSKDFEVKRS